MTTENQYYYAARAEEEMKAASRATDAKAAAVHFELASRYRAVAVSYAHEQILTNLEDHASEIGSAAGADNFHQIRQLGPA